MAQLFAVTLECIYCGTARDEVTEVAPEVDKIRPLAFRCQCTPEPDYDCYDWTDHRIAKVEPLRKRCRMDEGDSILVRRADGREVLTGYTRYEDDMWPHVARILDPRHWSH